MKLKAALVLPIGITLSSCMMPSNNSSMADPNGAYADPNNPYAVPGVSTSGAYSPVTQSPATDSPYQPIPDVQVNAPASYTPAPTTPAVIPSTPSSGGGAGASTHTVGAGDTLWGLSRKYGVSVDSIRQANGLSGDTIVTGQTLSIPR